MRKKKKFKFLTIKKVYIIAVLLVVALSITLGITVKVCASSSPVSQYTIVVDAGHGGIDGGCVGSVTGVTESELNLKVAKKLEHTLTNFGFKVVMTRVSEDGLYSQLAKNKKLDDMKKRKSIIEKSNADMVVSIHMNSFPNGHEHGAQTFYQTGSKSGQQLAQLIQDQLVEKLYLARANANHSDLYILKCTNNPSVVVEGGFLTNEKDENLLITQEYQSKFAYAISCGIVKYFRMSNTI